MIGNPCHPKITKPVTTSSLRIIPLHDDLQQFNIIHSRLHSQTVSPIYPSARVVCEKEILDAYIGNGTFCVCHLLHVQNRLVTVMNTDRCCFTI